MTIKKYIQFAIDNGLIIEGSKVLGVVGDMTEYTTMHIELEDGSLTTQYIIEVITSRNFIEAIARGIIKKGAIADCILVGDVSLFYNYIDTEDGFNTVYNEILIQQAFAIADDKLLEYINKLELGTTTKN